MHVAPGVGSVELQTCYANYTKLDAWQPVKIQYAVLLHLFMHVPQRLRCCCSYGRCLLAPVIEVLMDCKGLHLMGFCLTMSALHIVIILRSGIRLAA